MKNAHKRKLSLHKETIRTLGKRELEAAAGGLVTAGTAAGSMCAGCTYESARVACSGHCSEKCHY